MLHSIWSWLTNPVDFVIWWPIFTGLCSLAYTKLDETTVGHAVLSFLASLGLDLPKLLAMLQSIFQSPAARAAKRAAKAAATKVVSVFVLLLLVLPSGCLSSAPIVPVTPANQAQISQCESTASLHNTMVIGDFVFTTGAGTMGALGALVSDPQAKTDFGIVAAGAGGLAAIATAVGALSSSNFADQQCSQVVGQLPANPQPASTTTVTVSPPALGTPAAPSTLGGSK